MSFKKKSTFIVRCRAYEAVDEPATRLCWDAAC